MKRSEMVKHIQEWVTHPVTCMPIWTFEEASEFLTSMEEYGMLPPQRLATTTEAFIIGRSFGKRGNINNLVQRTWEPEDE